LVIDYLDLMVIGAWCLGFGAYYPYIDKRVSILEPKPLPSQLAAVRRMEASGLHN
jgi:hypothetical protein